MRYRTTIPQTGKTTTGIPVVEALGVEPAARRTFDALSYSNRSWHVLQVTGAKTDETQQRRIAKSVEALKEGRPR
jgi:uncharacterized protein YdeI (YjbR/CyaY-like superfamily)